MPFQYTNSVLCRWKCHIKKADHKVSYEMFKKWPLTWRGSCWPILHRLCENNLEVREVTTDPDSSARRAADSLNQDGLLKKAYPLLTHFPVSVWKSIKRVERLLMVMLTAAKAGKNPQCCTWCSRPVQSHDKPGLHHIKFKNKLFYATDAVMYCYMGVHALCKKHSFACRGAINDNWLKKRTYIGHDFKLPYSIENEDLLRAGVSKRLSPAILDKTIKNSNSQKVESFNRVPQRSLPRNVTFTRSFSGRAHSDVQSSNHGPGNSVQGTGAGVRAAISLRWLCRQVPRPASELLWNEQKTSEITIL